ncbi:DNA-processing protein DprA [Gottschalkiaceae bacterium SANA]|nr:DNA-processing protein DprA [Gottschalkiaceae bacterium SANA]
MKFLLAWLRAEHCPYEDLRLLIENTSTVELSISMPDHLRLKDGLSKKTKQAIRNYQPKSFRSQLEKQMLENQTRIVLWRDNDYPTSLYNVDDPPPILYVKGLGQFPPSRAMAIVGSRHTTPYGRRATERFASDLALETITIISGFAEGIDTVAHRTALKYGQTLAVLGCGIDWIYPKSNESLYYEIANKGVLISEFPFGEKPWGHNFPFRNRLISGLSEAILFMEGTHKSGALSTVRHGLKQGKDIYALPGDIDRKNSQGPNQLIFDGAEPLLCIEQILTNGGGPAIDKACTDETHKLNSLSSLENVIYEMVSKEPVSVQQLQNLSNQSIHDIVSVLTSLELKSLIQRQGNQFYRTGR